MISSTKECDEPDLRGQHEQVASDYLFCIFSVNCIFQKTPSLPPKVLETASFLDQAFAKEKLKLQRSIMGKSLWLSVYVKGGTIRAKQVTDRVLGRYATENWASQTWFGGKIWERSFELPSGAGFSIILSKPDGETKVNIQIPLSY